MKILILCTANIRRSAMALGIMKNMISSGGLNIDVNSFGLAAFDGQVVDKKAVVVMEKMGIDISEHKAVRVVKEDFDAVDIIYAMTYSQREIILDSLPELEGKIKVLDIPDPVNGSIADFEECRDRINEYFTQEVKKLSDD